MRALKRTSTAIGTLLAITVVAAPTVVHGQQAETGHEHHAHMRGGEAHSEGGQPLAETTDQCKQMMDKHEAMMAKRTQMLVELDQLVAKMNATTGEAQVATMAELFTRLVKQNKQMHGMTIEMQPQMMQHMMMHMHTEGAMQTCPMMTGMMGGHTVATESKREDHSQHH
jgi:hypothetical protein